MGLTTIGASKRLSRHITNSAFVKSRVYSWIKSIPSDEIVVDILEECPVGDSTYLMDAEVFWISQIRAFGHRIKNHTDGGGGTTGATWTLPEETKRKQGLAKVGELNPQFGKPAWNSGMKMSDKWLDTRVQAQKKLWDDPKYREAMAKKNGDALRKTNHTRWHTNRNIIKPGCEYCPNT